MFPLFCSSCFLRLIQIESHTTRQPIIWIWPCLTSLASMRYQLDWSAHQLEELQQDRLHVCFFAPPSGHPLYRRSGRYTSQRQIYGYLCSQATIANWTRNPSHYFCRPLPPTASQIFYLPRQRQLQRGSYLQASWAYPCLSIGNQPIADLWAGSPSNIQPEDASIFRQS